jgi:ATP-binding cassette, subfamily G (WHITE), member 2, PDR
MINQIQPRFFFLRDLYEIRERPSKIYHWRAFLIAAVLAEIPWNLTVGTLFFFGWYFPIGKNLLSALLITGFWKDVTIPAARAAFQWLFLMVWQLFISTFAQLICSFVSSLFILY